MKRCSNDQRKMRQFLETVQETSDGLPSFPASADSDQDTITRSASPGGLFIPTRRYGVEIDDEDIPSATRRQTGIRNVRFTVYPVQMSAEGLNPSKSAVDLRMRGGPAADSEKSDQKQKDTQKPHGHQDDGGAESSGAVVTDGGTVVVPNRDVAAQQDDGANDCCERCLVCMMCGGPGCTVQ